MEELTLAQVLLPIVMSLLLMGVGFIGGAMITLKRQTDDLWEWHKPNEQGQQSWKLTPEVISMVVKTAIHEVYDAQRGDD